jgi:hypothetical protein
MINQTALQKKNSTASTSSALCSVIHLVQNKNKKQHPEKNKGFLMQ